jgi:hypothetical protein
VGREKGSERGGGRDMSVAAGGAASLPAEEWSTAGQRQWRGALGHGRSERTRGGRRLCGAGVRQCHPGQPIRVRRVVA